MRNLARFALAFVALSFALPSTWAADIVYLKGESNRKPGEVTSSTKTELVMMVGLGSAKKEERIPANTIDRIQWDGEPPSLNLARIAEQNGRVQDALADYEKILGDTKNDEKFLKTDLEYLIANAHAKLAKGDPSKVEDAIQKLSGFTTANATSFRFYPALMALGETYLIKGDYANAETAFKQLEGAPFDDYKMAAQIAQGRLLLRKNDVPGAQSLFTQVAGKPAKTDAEKARQYEARLGVATCLQRQNQFEKAASELDQIIKQAPASDTKTMGEAYLRKGDNLLAAGQKKDALLAYLHVDVLFSGEKDLHAEALYHLSTLWNEVAQPGRAADARTKLTSDYPNSEWARKLAGG